VALFPKQEKEQKKRNGSEKSSVVRWAVSTSPRNDVSTAALRSNQKLDDQRGGERSTLELKKSKKEPEQTEKGSGVWGEEEARNSVANTELKRRNRRCPEQGYGLS